MAQDTENLTISQGGKFEVHLSATPSTGHIWRIAYIPDQVESLGSSFVQTGQDPPKPGAPVVQVFRFRAVNLGSAQIRLELKRSWETNPAQIHVVELTVTG
jgi:predicted secreted protein